MHVLTIVSSDDAQQGDVTAILQLHDGENEDDVFVEWLRHERPFFTNNKSKEECLEQQTDFTYYCNEVKYRAKLEGLRSDNLTG